ncbi:MAG: hypothetical protein ABW023_13790 [Sphingomonas sp.]
MRWLRLGTALVIVAIVAMLGVAWHSATHGDTGGEQIRARAKAQMERIEAEARRLENATR